MNQYWTVTKEGKYYTASGKWTANINLAYVYDQPTAQAIAEQLGGQAINIKGRY